MRSVFFVKGYKILLGVILVLVLAGTHAIGKSIDENTARTVGMNFLLAKGVPVSGASGMVTAYTANGTIDGRNVTSYYVFNITGRHAFVMVSADDIIRPILAYSDESSFDINHLPPATKDWIDGYRKKITIAIAHKVPAKSTTPAAWSELIAGTPSWKNARTTSVSPLLGSILWDQGPGPYPAYDTSGFYNDSCPGTGATQALTGCVATAMAQVMKYWNWPTVGTGCYTYPCTSYYTGYTGLDSAIQLSADFGNTVYGWGSMQTPKETTHDPTLAQLMFHAGVSVSMQYGTVSSSAVPLEVEALPYSQSAEYALKTYFHYKRTLIGIPRYGVGGDFVDSIPEATWISMLQTELNAGRPVIYDGYGAEGGHCWVCDGYESSSNLFHFNWGWNGDYNANYSVDDLAPSGTADTFNEDEGALFGIEPDSFSNTPGNIQLLAHLTSLTSSPMNYKTPFAVATKVFNSGTSSFTGDFAMQVFDTLNGLVGTLQTYTSETIAAGDSAAYTFGPSIMYGMVPMDYYHIQAMYRPSGTSAWIPVANNGTYINYTTADVMNDTDITLNKSIAVTSPEPVISGAALNLNTQLINFGSLAFNGTVRAVMINVATGASYVVDSLVGQSLLPDLNNTLNTSFTNSAFTAPNGLYALVIQHEYNGAGGFYTTGSTLYENPVIVRVGLNLSAPSTILNNDVYVFPNPAKDKITILPNGVSITAIEVFDIMGRQVPKQIQPNGKLAITVPVSDLVPGEYIIRIQTDAQQTLTKKLIITK